MVILRVFIVSLLICVCCVSLLSAEEGPKTLSLTGKEAVIIRLKGNVKVLKKKEESWQKATEGLHLFEGDSLKTGRRSYAEICFDLDDKPKKNVVKVSSKTTITLNAIKPTQTEIGLDKGELFCLIEKLKEGSTFEVRTPTAVCGSRGTGWQIKYNPKTIVLCYENAIYIQPLDEEGNPIGEGFIVQEGEKKAIALLKVGITQRLSEQEKRKWNSWRKDLGQFLDAYIVDTDPTADGYTPPSDSDADDLSDDTDDLDEDGEDSQDDAEDDKNSEQDSQGSGRRGASNPDSDGDGVLDKDDLYPNDPNRASGNDLDGDGIDDEFDNDIDGDGYANSNDDFPRDYYDWLDFDIDGYGDNEDAFPEDNVIDDGPFGYGSRHQMRQEILDLIEEGQLRNDIAQHTRDIYWRDMDARLTQVADHQAHKVMRDRWGNRVRVEQYVLKPTNQTIQILSVNLRTAGPNAGVSSMDFQIQFYQDINGADLKNLPWGDYMHTCEWDEVFGGDFDGDDDVQFIVYDRDGEYYDPRLAQVGYPDGYPIPETFSLEVKNPYGNSFKAIETYSKINDIGDIGWYQSQVRDREMLINGTYMDYADTGDFEDEWGDDWNSQNRFTFIDRFTDDRWLIGAFYLIENDGNPVENVDEDYLDEDETLDIRGIRDLLNPDYNLEMVFFSSEFGDTPGDLPNEIADYMEEELSEAERESYIEGLYNNPSIRTIDVITIPEITTPYVEFDDLGGGDDEPEPR